MPEIQLKYKIGDFKKTKITCSDDAACVFRNLFDQDLIEYREEMIAIFLNQRNNTIAWLKVATGGISGVVCDVRMIMVAALKCGASAVILAHNHPSGETTPSNADKKMTEKIKKAGDILDINFLDHLIISKNDFFSFADEIGM